MNSSNILFLFILFFCSCDSESQRQRYIRRREIKYQERIKLTWDSVKNGLREVYIYDTSDKRITQEEAETFLLSGEYEMDPKDIIDIKLHKITKEALDLQVKQKPPTCNAFPVNSYFPEFSSRDTNGRVLSNSYFNGKLLIINFWFLACAPCRSEMNGLNELVNTYSSKGANFISFTPDKLEQIVKAKNKLNFKYAIIPDQAKFIDFVKIEAFPTHVVVNKKGKIIFSCAESGKRAIYWLKKTIDSCLAAR
jgi:peroxiredoxin